MAFTPNFTLIVSLVVIKGDTQTAYKTLQADTTRDYTLCVVTETSLFRRRRNSFFGVYAVAYIAQYARISLCH
jgi:hypothetical protein